MLLQDRIEELGSGVLEITNTNVNLVGFTSAERLEDYYERKIDCHYSQGIYDYEKLDYSRIQDDALFVTIKDGKEISRYQFESLLVIKNEDEFKYTEVDEDNKKKVKSKVFKIRKCKYTNKYNYIDNNESKLFNSFEQLDEFVFRSFNKHLKEIFFVKHYVDSNLFAYKDIDIKNKFFHSKEELIKFIYEKFNRLPKSSEIIRDKKADKKSYNKIVAIDFETANSNLRSICSIGVAIYEDNEIIYSNEFLVNPEEEFEAKNIKIHNITEKDVGDKLTFPGVWNKIENVIDKNTLVIAHNASFDMNALNEACKKYDIPTPSFKYLCTYKAAKKVLPNLKKYSLDSLAESLNIKFDHHKAGDDALVCLKIFNYMTKELNTLYKEDIEKHLQVNIGEFKELEVKRTKRNNNSNNLVKIYKNRHVDIKDIKPEGDIDKNSGINGLVFVFTGDLKKFGNKKDAMQKVVNLGGVLADRVTKNTDYLVVGEIDLQLTKGKEKTTKLLKAEEYKEKGINIEIIDEDEFIKLLDSRYDEVCFELDMDTSNKEINDSIEPKKEWGYFESEDEKMHMLKEFKLIPPKAIKIDKVFFYKGAYTNSTIQCEILGYMYCDNDILVIKIGDKIHCIRGEYLKQMQDKNFNKFNFD